MKKQLLKTFAIAGCFLSTMSFGQDTWNIFAEDETLGEGVVIGANTDIFVWDNTYEAVTLDPYMGVGSLGFTPANAGAAGWAGMGITRRDSVDLSAFATGYYNVAIIIGEADADATVTLGITAVDGEWLYEFVPGSDPAGFTRNGEWHFLSIPLADFTPKDGGAALTAETFDQVTIPTYLLGLATVGIDEIYLSKTQVTGVFESSEYKALSAYPNPATEAIVLDGVNGTANVTVIDLLGNEVLSTTVEGNESLNIEGLNEGRYMARIQTASEVFVTNFVKQ